MKDQIEKEFQSEFEKEKKHFNDNENERSETYQAIVKEIQHHKIRVRELESKLKQ